MPMPNQIYQHRHGGIYVVDSIATHTGTKEELVIYTHLYPFELKTWARPVAEWTEVRFRKITEDEANQLMQQNREEFQAKITKTKLASKS